MKTQTLSIRDFRSQMGSSLDRVDAGETVLFRRRGQTYTIVPVFDHNSVTPELMAKIQKARQEFRDGKCIRLSTPEEIDKYFDSL